LFLTAASALFAQPRQGQPVNFDTAELHVSPVQGNIYALFGPGGNITIQAGQDGALLVDTMFAPLAPRIATEVKKLSAKPIRMMVVTHVHSDHTGGIGALAKMGAPGITVPDGGGATVFAHENVLVRMTQSGSNTSSADYPNREYDTPTKDFFFNGEAVILFHEPKAHTDGDTIVFFRRSDVISTGDIFTPERYPFIDIERGGSINGEIAALNHILHLTVPEKLQDGGTQVIPGHGRICDEADVVEYRDMVTIIRDRVQDAIQRGRDLSQVKAENLTADYDTRYGPGDIFVEAVYKSLGGK
jgi:glyoxylase-like metal-dependent hydrolase (beta-lactamase superfamily II)